MHGVIATIMINDDRLKKTVKIKIEIRKLFHGTWEDV